MADYTSTAGGGNALEKQACEFLQCARDRKAQIVRDLMEGYFFTNPRRAREVQSAYRATRGIPDDVAELQTTLGVECAEDFAGLMVNTFMPANFPWLKRGRGSLGDDEWREIKDRVAADDKVILAAIAESNFDAIAQQSFDPDLSLGMSAIWIADDKIWKSPKCRSIPLRRLEIELGPDGEIGPRFVVEHHMAKDLPVVLAGHTLPANVARKVTSRQKDMCEVVWGFWRDHSVEGTETWQHVIMADKKIVDEERREGEGSIELVVTPFAPNPDHPWGDGPGLKALPYLRVLDCLSGMTQDRADIAANPPFSYPHDGVINFEGGIVAGRAYPHAQGTTENEFVPLYFQGDPDVGFFTLQDLEKSIKRLWYVDRPEQVGKTPPTASQWLDQIVEMQKRMGLVGQRFWRDGPRQYFLRFKYLLEKRGRLEPIKSAGSLAPYNPAIKGQEYQEVQLATKLMEIVMAFGGVQGQALLKAPETFKNIKAKLGDEIVVFNDMARVLQLMAQLVPQTDLNIGNSKVN